MALLSGLPVCAQVNILTANGGNDRTNANLQEVQLLPATVHADTFGKVGTFAVDGQVYAQPLYVSGLSMPGAGTRNVLFVATNHNSVYAYDADSPSKATLLWQVNLGPSVPAEMLFGDVYGDVANEVGILSTGAIDPQAGVLYVVANILQNGAPEFYLHALDLGTGKEKMNGPVAIGAMVPAGGTVLADVQFNPVYHLQRPGLLLANNAVYIAFGSHGDQTPYHGWLLSYDASDLTRQLGVFNSTPSMQSGAIWQSGRGPAADDQGNVYVVIGNGDYDGDQNFGESFVKLAGASAARVGSFTPTEWKAMSDNDMDLSAGPALLGGTGTPTAPSGRGSVIGADKLGNLYVLNPDTMGPTGSGDSGAQTSFSASAFSIFNFAVWNRSSGSYVYVQGETEPARCFEFTGGGFNSIPVSATTNAVPFGRVGMTISANGGQDGTGILWETTGDYNDGSGAGTLHAFDASNLAFELWNSDMSAARDSMGSIAKFANPTVANGKVYVPTSSNSIVVYGLLGSGGAETARPSIRAETNAASYAQNSVSPGEFVTIFGSNLGPQNAAGMQLAASGLVATDLSETEVRFDGMPSPMAYASASQVNAIVPFGLLADYTQMTVEYQGQVSDPVRLAVVPSSSGIFTADGSGIGQGLIFNQNGGINSASNPAPVGSVVVFYATGAGRLLPGMVDGAVVAGNNVPLPVLPVTALVGGLPAQVLYAGGSPGIVAGIIQVNVLIPAGAMVGPTVPIAIQIGGSTSQPGLSLALQSLAKNTHPGVQ